MEKNEWFERWFDTEYYPILYDHRNNEEARQWIDALFSFLNPSPQTKILDLACGRGRHSIYLNTLGYEVLGIDLSANSIAEAKKHENPRLKFEVADMRNLRMEACTDIALNLFTSFGYFENNTEHLEVLVSVYNALRRNGYFVLDYINAQATIDELEPEQRVTKRGIDFLIAKHIEDHKIVKRISFTHEGKQRVYEERVTAFSKEELVQLFEQAGFSDLQFFGDYELAPLTASSPRMIIIARK